MFAMKTRYEVENGIDALNCPERQLPACTDSRADIGPHAEPRVDERLLEIMLSVTPYRSLEARARRVVLWDEFD